MQQTAKKTLAILLALCMVLGFVPMGAQAAVLNGEDYITQQLYLGEDLVLHLRGNVPDEYKDGATATVTYGDNTDNYTIDDMTPDENGLYDLPVEMAVAQMTENINLVLNGVFMGMTVEAINENYSIRNYLTAIIDGDYSQTTKDLCLELLNMGAWAQLYFNHNINDLANTGYSTSATNSVPEESPAVSAEGKVDGISFYGTSVRFLSKTAVRFYFEADGTVDGYTFTIDGVEYEPTQKDGLYYIETPGINPQDMSDVITVNVTDGANTLSVGYAPIWYFVRTYNKTENEYAKGLMEAAYSYYKTAETYTTNICMDVEISTLSGNYESIGLGFYPLDFEGDINNYVDRIEIPTGTTYTVKLDQGKYLVDGEFLGIGVTVLGGPTWDATLPDGSADRHNITISDLRLEGPEDRPVDLNFATIASGQDGTGYTNANAGGTATLADGVITIANGFFTDGYKITFNEVATYLKLDMDISTLSGNYESIGIGFYPYNFEGDINDYTDRIEIPTGSYTVKLDLSKYLVDGELPGIGFAVLGGPAWNSMLEDGVTYDRHNITVSNICLEGELDQNIDLSQASLVSGQNGTGYTNANAGGTASVADGIITITNGFFTDGYKVTFVDETIPEETEPEVTEPEVTEPEETEPPAEEPDTYLCMDVLITALSDTSYPIDLRFYPTNFEGNVHETYTDKVSVTAGTAATVKLDMSKYLVDGELTGFGLGVFGGPEWNTPLAAGGYDRLAITVSNVKLEGYDTKNMVLSNVSTGFVNATQTGEASIVDGAAVITNSFQYAGYTIGIEEDTRTFISMDVQIDALSDTAYPIDLRFYPTNFEGNVHETYTDKVSVTAGTAATVKLDMSKYLVDGELTGFGLGVFGGPEWNTPLAAGGYDRLAITVSNVKLEGYDTKNIVLSNVATGFVNATQTGEASIVDGAAVITNSFQYAGYTIVIEEIINDYISMDVLINALSGSTDAVDVCFYPENFAGDIYSECTDKISVTAGTKTTITLKAKDYLVDGQLTGIGVALLGGPEWNTPLEGGGYDRISVTISDIRREGDNAQLMAASTATVGLSNANAAGAASAVDGTVVISDTFRYAGYEITLVEDTNTYICMDVLLTTLSNSTDSINLRLYPSNFAGDIYNEYTALVPVTAGTKTTIKLKVDDYLVDGQLSGIGLAIFGGPEWNTPLDAGGYDRVSINISNVHLEGAEARAIDLNNGSVVVGIANSNTSGEASIIDGEVVITNGFQYIGYKITF